MQYEIIGEPFPAVVCTLKRGEKMKTEKGSMVWMDPCMSMETTGGGVKKMFSKAFSGESMFQNIYTAQSDAVALRSALDFPERSCRSPSSRAKSSSRKRWPSSRPR